jgi:hypothetical protein
MFGMMPVLRFRRGVIGMSATPFPSEDRQPDDDRDDREDQAEPCGSRSTRMDEHLHRSFGAPGSSAIRLGVK